MVIIHPATVRPSIASDSFASDLLAALFLGIFTADRNIFFIRRFRRLELPGTLEVAGNSGLLRGIVGPHIKDPRGSATGACTTIWEVGRIGS